MDVAGLLKNQRDFFNSDVTKSISFRIEQLNKLKNLLVEHQGDFKLALQMDLDKHFAESMISEILPVLKELDHAIKYLKKWVKPKKVPTPLILFPGRSYIQPEAYGCTLIMSPWNYPIMLTFSPLIGAISAGNCAILKPSEMASETQRLIVDLVNKTFDANYIHAVNLDSEETAELLKHRFDYIFFTGSTSIGKKVMVAAAEHLTPLTLELGGKSPCIVDQTADLDFAARRIIWAKMMNAGQTCIAPDYLYVETSCKDKLVEKLRVVIREFYGEQPDKSASFGRIINSHHFERLNKLLISGHIVHGGKTDSETQYIEPTLLDKVTWHDAVMQEEVFGPILPIIEFETIDAVIETLKNKEKPLALYLFTNDKKIQEKVINELSFGGGCLNDCVVHIANHHLPFGGVGNSGLGNYHGEASFKTFSHMKSVYSKTIKFDFKLEYPPFNEKKLRWIKWLL